MSPRLAVGDVSVAIDGSAPWPPGNTMSEPNEGFPPPRADAAAGRKAAVAASTTSATANRTAVPTHNDEPICPSLGSRGSTPALGTARCIRKKRSQNAGRGRSPHDLDAAVLAIDDDLGHRHIQLRAQPRHEVSLLPARALGGVRRDDHLVGPEAPQVVLDGEQRMHRIADMASG